MPTHVLLCLSCPRRASTTFSLFCHAAESARARTPRPLISRGGFYASSSTQSPSGAYAHAYSSSSTQSPRGAYAYASFSTQSPLGAYASSSTQLRRLHFRTGMSPVAHTSADFAGRRWTENSFQTRAPTRRSGTFGIGARLFGLLTFFFVHFLLISFSLCELNNSNPTRMTRIFLKERMKRKSKRVVF